MKTSENGRLWDDCGTPLLTDSLPQGCNSNLIELNQHICPLCYTQNMQQSGLDENGFIISEVSYENILPEYKELIAASIAALKSALPNLIHSIYVYGSVARGDAVGEKSDMDLLVISSQKLTETERSTLNTMLADLSALHGSLVREVGVADCTYDEVLDTKNTYGWGAYLKILCVCVNGEDLTKRFGNFKLSSEIASGFNGDIDTALQSALRKIRDAETDEEAGKIAATFARKLIRTCYSLVMTRAQVWTTKLSEQADVFIQYFPEKRAFVRTLQDWVVQPPHNRNDEERKKRLISRGQSDLANQKMLDWAEYLRNEVVTIPGAIIFDTSSLQIEEAVTKLWQVMNKN